MAKKKQLYDKEGNVVYPITHVDCVEGMSDGTNLLLNSNIPVSNDSNLIARYKFVNANFLKEGEPFTLTIKGSIGEGKSNVFYIYNTNGQDRYRLGEVAYISSEGIYRLKANWVSNPNEKELIVYCGKNTDTGIISTIEWIKLERGTNATAYIPAAEEIATKVLIEEAKFALFDDEWEALGGTIVDKVNHIYGLNGLNDITYEQAIAIKAAGALTIPYVKAFADGIRTHLSYALDNVNIAASDRIYLNSTFRYCRTIEVINLKGNETYPIRAMNIHQFCESCLKLERIIGVIDLRQMTNQNNKPFGSCPKLTEVFLQNLKVNINLDGAPLLSLESFKYLITNAANTSAITIQVHPDVYSKLTDESNEEWNAVYKQAQERNITFTTVEAVSSVNEEV